MAKSTSYMKAYRAKKKEQQPTNTKSIENMNEAQLRQENQQLKKERENNKKNHENMPSRTTNSKSGQFNEFRYGGLDWWKEKYSESASYLHMNRVSEDGNKVVVKVADSMVRETKYGFSLQLDNQNVVYLKDWQVEYHTEPYHGKTGYEVLLTRQYFTPKKTNYINEDFASPDFSNHSFEHWVQVAKEQEQAGNFVRIRV